MHPLTDGVSTLDHTDQHDRDREHQKQVDEAPQRVGAHHAEQPHQHEQDEDEVQHRRSPLYEWRGAPVASRTILVADFTVLDALSSASRAEDSSSSAS